MLSDLEFITYVKMFPTLTLKELNTKFSALTMSFIADE
jgi:hypothetical protein